MKKISIASDHAGFHLKETLVQVLREKGYDVHDLGAHELIPEDDYPTYISKVAHDISHYEEARVHGHHSSHNSIGEPHRHHVGIVIGGSGQGEAMVANKYPHVRATVLYGGDHSGGSRELLRKITVLSREHNDANILSIGARFISHDEAIEMVLLWLMTDFKGEERHERRISEIEKIEYNME